MAIETGIIAELLTKAIYDVAPKIYEGVSRAARARTQHRKQFTNIGEFWEQGAALKTGEHVSVDGVLSKYVRFS